MELKALLKSKSLQLKMKPTQFNACLRALELRKNQNLFNATTTLTMLKNTILLYHNFIFVLH